MSFGANVVALLETYENCLSLLKAFKRRNKDHGNVTSDKQSLLRRRLKADRAKVERAYSSRLSQSGSRLEKGDGKALIYLPPHFVPARNCILRYQWNTQQKRSRLSAES